MDVSKEVLAKMKILDPDLEDDRASEDTIGQLVDIAGVVADTDGIGEGDPKRTLALALITLDMLTKTNEGGVTGKTIKDVEITYSTSTGSKWFKWYQSLLDGTLDDSKALHYVGLN